MRRWYLLLLLPFAGLLYPPLYATEDPELFGFPFFYWYQFAWVPLTAGITYFVYAIDLQLLGGVWMLQTLPAVMLALYTRWFHRWGLLAGWAVGMVAGTWIAASQDYTPVWDTPFIEATAYTGLVALLLNLAVTTVLTLVLGNRGRADELDETRAEDFDELHETREPAPTVGAGVA